jgi:hypothetical protein
MVLNDNAQASFMSQKLVYIFLALFVCNSAFALLEKLADG